MFWHHSRFLLDRKRTFVGKVNLRYTGVIRPQGELDNMRILIMTLLLSYTLTAQAGDWPQGLGPHRTGIAVDEPALQPWGDAGPAKQWSHPVGMGYAGPVVSGDHVVIFHRMGNAERLEALHRVTGKVVWSHDFKAFYSGGYNSDQGPRSTPVIAAGQVYAYGAAGDLHCVTLATGKVVWSRAINDDYQAPDGYFGAGSSPLVLGSKLIVNVGADDAGIVAVDVKTGKTIWKATNEKASYSSPTTITINNQTKALLITRMKALALDPDSGEILFETPFGKQGPTVNGATPLAFDNKIFLSASYGIGAELLQVSSDGKKVTRKWSGDDILSSQYSTSLLHNKALFGTHGREDLGVAALRCVSAETGKVLWEETGFGVAHCILVRDRILALNTAGELVLLQADSSSYKPMARATVGQGVTRSFPAFSNGQFFFRSNNGRTGTLTALKLK